MGIGRPAELFKLSTSYDTARIALNSLTDSADHYALFDDLTLEILLGSLNEVTTAEFIAKTLSCLDETDCYAVILTMSNRFPEQVNISIFIRIPCNTS